MQEQSTASRAMRGSFSLLYCIALCWLSACASPEEQAFMSPATAPSLEAAVLHTGSGADLPLRSWIPEGKTEAIIIALHGFNDYSNAFTGTGEYLRQHHIAVYAYDQRGFGANQTPGIWGGRQNLVGDLKQMVVAVKQEYPHIPVYLLGESMGGAVVISAVTTQDFPKVDGIILSAPAVWGDETMNSFYRATLWLMAHSFPSGSVTGKDLKIQASDNIPMLQALGHDPLIIKKTRVDAIWGIVQLMDEAYRSADKLNTPTLLLYGAKDQVIPRAPIRKIIDRLNAPFTVAYYPAGYHMLLRDLRAKRVLNDIKSWIENRYRALPSGDDNGWGDKL